MKSLGDGDFFGGAVTLTARLLGAAVVERTADARTPESLGLRQLRGVAEPLELFRLVSGLIAASGAALDRRRRRPN